MKKMNNFVSSVVNLGFQKSIKKNSKKSKSQSLFFFNFIPTPTISTWPTIIRLKTTQSKTGF